jgi:DNA-binding XRE family transcriptional regulator
MILPPVVSAAIRRVLDARARWIGPGIPRDLDLALRELAVAVHTESGRDLAREREAAGLTKAEVARRMGVSRPYLQRVEEHPSPTERTKAKYRKALKEERHADD